MLFIITMLLQGDGDTLSVTDSLSLGSVTCNNSEAAASPAQQHPARPGNKYFYVANIFIVVPRVTKNSKKYISDIIYKITHSNPTTFQSYTLPILHSSNLTLFHSHILPILHPSNPTLFKCYTLPILHSSNSALLQS